MARLFDKLNVLLKSNLHSVLRDRGASRDAPDVSRAPGIDIEQTIAQLQGRIEAALDEEDRTLNKLNAMQQQIASWDTEADRALQAGDEAAARYLVRQIQLTRQQYALLQADLDQHRRATGELIQHVNELEAVAAQIERERKPGTPDSTAVADDEPLAERLRRAREMALTESGVHTMPSVDEATLEVDRQAIDDDITDRRKRLSL